MGGSVSTTSTSSKDFKNSEDYKYWNSATPSGFITQELIDAKKKEFASTLAEIEKSEAAAAKAEKTQADLTQAIADMAAAANRKEPIKQDIDVKQSELERQKRLEALRAGLLSTKMYKGPGATASLGSPAKSIYGGLKTKLGE